MDEIRIGVYDEHNLLLEGICELLIGIPEIKVTLRESSKTKLLKLLNVEKVNILIVNVYSLNTDILEMIHRLNTLQPDIRVLVISNSSDEQTIHKTIRAGAKGFLAKDSSRQDLLEALYTLRNGYDYYSKSITNLLLQKYLSGLKDGGENPDTGITNELSSRELEILKLWGNSFSNKEISDKLFISVRTVESHKNHIMQKLNLKTAVDLVKFGIRNNIIEI